MNNEKSLASHQSLPHAELATRSPELLHASNWLEVSDGLMRARIAQLQELGAPDADSPDFMGAHKAFIEMARARLEEQDPNFITMFKDLEIKALDQGEMHQTGYDVAHIKQLDFFASMVEEAQHRHDGQTDPIDPHQHTHTYRA